MRMTRAVGICMAGTGPARNPFDESTYNKANCEDYGKLTFLLNHGDKFFCPRCRAKGNVIPEEGSFLNKNPLVRQVRVEYNYDSLGGRFRDLAIVTDDSIDPEANVYILRSPLIKTDKRALKVAEQTLGNLRQMNNLPDPSVAAKIGEFTMDLGLSKDEWRDKMVTFEHMLKMLAKGSAHSH